jgi:hypothetical protein
MFAKRGAVRTCTFIRFPLINIKTGVGRAVFLNKGRPVDTTGQHYLSIVHIPVKMETMFHQFL